MANRAQIILLQNNRTQNSTNIANQFLVALRTRPRSRPDLLVIPWDKASKQFSFSPNVDDFQNSPSDISQEDLEHFLTQLKTIPEYDPFPSRGLFGGSKKKFNNRINTSNFFYFFVNFFCVWISDYFEHISFSQHSE